MDLELPVVAEMRIRLAVHLLSERLRQTKALPGRDRFCGFSNQTRDHNGRVSLPHRSICTKPDQLPEAAFEAKHGAGIGFKCLCIGRMGVIDAPQQFLVSRQMKSQILLEPQHVADQGRVPFFLVSALRHPEQKSNPSNKKDKGQPGKYP